MIVLLKHWWKKNQLEMLISLDVSKTGWWNIKVCNSYVKYKIARGLYYIIKDKYNIIQSGTMTNKKFNNTLLVNKLKEMWTFKS